VHFRGDIRRTFPGAKLVQWTPLRPRLRKGHLLKSPNRAPFVEALLTRQGQDCIEVSSFEPDFDRQMVNRFLKDPAVLDYLCREKGLTVDRRVGAGRQARFYCYRLGDCSKRPEGY
jgi:hypothetical protein